MSLLWAVPVAAAAAGVVVVVATARAFEDEAVALRREVQRLGELREPLAAVRATMAESDELAEGFRRRHPLDNDT